jgi:hypothetical protein
MIGLVPSGVGGTTCGVEVVVGRAGLVGHRRRTVAARSVGVVEGVQVMLPVVAALVVTPPVNVPKVIVIVEPAMTIGDVVNVRFPVT